MSKVGLFDVEWCVTCCFVVLQLNKRSGSLIVNKDIIKDNNKNHSSDQTSNLQIHADMPITEIGGYLGSC